MNEITKTARLKSDKTGTSPYVRTTLVKDTVYNLGGPIDRFPLTFPFF